MRIVIVSFTTRGRELARHVGAQLAQQGDDVRVFCTARLADAPGVEAVDDLASWTGRAFETADALLFVSACGIATRAIAPYVADKFCDPAVVCMDEKGQFAIPILSGHVGGANELARRVARLCGGVAALTTATDVNDVFAVDEWARSQDLAIVERELAKQVSAALLEGVPVGFCSPYAVGGTLPAGLVDNPVEGTVKLGIAVGPDATSLPFAQTLHLVPRVAVVGVGCKRGVSAEDVLALVDACLEEAHVASEAVHTLASIDVKAGEPGLLAAARERGWKPRFHSAQELLSVPGSFSASEFVRQTVGVDNVCERAACATGERLLLGKRAARGVTVAVAVREPHLSFDACPPQQGSSPLPAPADSVEKPSWAPGGQSPSCGKPAQRLTCVGLGPGAAGDLTAHARAALASAEVIVGYRTYLDLIRADYPRAEYLSTPMRGEVERCHLALEQAARGRRVAMVCSGDPGVYGMAGLLFELLPAYRGVRVEVIPGVTAANGGAALLGAPLMHDWCSISLSDLMTPWDTIAKRLRAAGEADFCIALYNPASRGRADYLRRACDILLESRAGSTVCGIVRNVGRQGESSVIMTLAELRDVQADMLTCVFVGNSQTTVIDGHMVTPRGYLQREA